MEIKFLKKCVWQFKRYEKKQVGRRIVYVDKILHFEKGEVQTNLPEKDVKQMIAAGYAKIEGKVEQTPASVQEKIEQTPANMQEKETKEVVHTKKEKPKK